MVDEMKHPLLRRIGLLTCTSAIVAACSFSTSIQRNALRYNETVANYNDQMLLYTVLRAREEAPINILALSTINGAVSVQGTLGSSAGYANIGASTAQHGVTAALTPGIQATSSPTWSMASLNTQGFMLGIIQPISPMYVVSKWSTGLDREFLLRLFIKSINIKDEHGYHQIRNDPSSPAAMSEFAERIRSWIPHMHMRALTVLEPLGPPWDPDTVTTATTTTDTSKHPTASATVEKSEVPNPASAALLGAYQSLVPLEGGTFHVGNVRSNSIDGRLGLQLYREYPQQVVLCVPRSTIGLQALTSSTVPIGEAEQQEEASAIAHYALELKSAAKNGAGRAPSVATPAPSPQPSGLGVASSQPKTPIPSSLSANLKVDRVAAILPLGACGQDELVLPPYTEDDNATNSGTYSHVEWRSIAEIIEYLGALLRPNDREFAGTWSETDTGGRVAIHTLFTLASDGRPGFAAVDYRGLSYTISTDSDRETRATRDHSMQALALLSELIGTAKVSSDLPNTQSIQLVP